MEKSSDKESNRTIISSVKKEFSDKESERIIPLGEFIDLVFKELDSPACVWNKRLDGYGYFDNPDCWKDTIIPLAFRVYELSQTDDEIYWWLLQLMSKIDLCKDSKEDFRKSDVFCVLAEQSPRHQRMILNSCVPEHAGELEKALLENDLDGFRKCMPSIFSDNNTIYDVGRMLKRISDMCHIYRKAVSYTKGGDTLGGLFLLFRYLYEYFSEAYKNSKRSCDGMAKNVFLALHQTQFSDDKLQFCAAADEIGELWVRSLILDYLRFKEKMPQEVSDILGKGLRENGSAELFEKLAVEFDKCEDEGQYVAKLVNEAGGWLEIGKYQFVHDILQCESPMVMPPFKPVRYRIHRHPVCSSEKIFYPYEYLGSENEVPMEDLETAMVENPSLAITLFLNDKDGGDSRLAKQNIENASPNVEGASENNPNKVGGTLNQKARRLIGDLLQKIPPTHIKSGWTIERLESVFDSILIEEQKGINEHLAQENIVKELFHNRSKYEHNGLKIMVFCKI